MKAWQKTVALDDHEEGAVIQGLMLLRNEELESNGADDFVGSLILKIIRTPQRKARSRDEAR